MAETLLALQHDGCVRDDGDPPVWIPSELRHVRGAFAGVWKNHDGELILARDPVGHRSLYWSKGRGGTPTWAFRLRDAIPTGGTRRLDPIGIATYLSTAYVPGHRTLLEGVESVEAGTRVHLSASGTATRRTFAPLPAAPTSYADEATLKQRLRTSLEDTVERLLPDGPVAATLSGGIDSSLVAALAAARRPLTTFSITFGPEHRDELEWSRMVAAHIGARHELVTVRPDDVMGYFDETVRALSEPNGDPLTVPNTMLFAAATQLGLGVVLNGEGGDPCFGGPKNGPLILATLYGESGALSHERAYLRAHQRLWDELDVALEPSLKANVPEGAVEALVTPWLEDSRWPSFLDRLMALNVAWKGGGHILPKVEHLGAARGALARSPLFDRELVRRAFELPPDMKRRGSIEKYLLKEAVRDLLPAAIVDRPKSGMMVPVEAWFEGPLRSFAEERLLDSTTLRGIIRRDFLEKLLARTLGGLRPRRGVKIWLLLTLESWIRQMGATL